uniref:Resolvase/invertase-type recombinase catalytic domain-containing protein n=1 Tax=Bradyrhizobium diazoefficiens TaxID=1355477 RepID=A0A809YUL5_9BRAD|nr:hypothetical protein XF4B_06850 [Bradyrhizobium diazoefficiens]
MRSAQSEETRAYSYVRFSTPSQQEGASFQRQMEKATKFALDHGLTLDTELNMTDIGVSAYRGKNARTGALAGFLEAVHRDTSLKAATFSLRTLTDCRATTSLKRKRCSRT